MCNEQGSFCQWQATRKQPGPVSTTDDISDKNIYILNENGIIKLG